MTLTQNEQRKMNRLAKRVAELRISQEALKPWAELAALKAKVAKMEADAAVGARVRNFAKGEVIQRLDNGDFCHIHWGHPSREKISSTPEEALFRVDAGGPFSKILANVKAKRADDSSKE